MNVLLIIDMQNAWMNVSTRIYADKDGVVNRINRFAEHIRESRGKVIFIQHDDEDTAIGSDGWQLISSLHVADGDLRVQKRACDSFAETDLLSTLQELGAQTVFISGSATEFCVDTTVRAAVSQGLDIVALSDAHTTSNRPHLDALSIVKHHNWVWSGIAVPSGSRLRVLSVGEVLDSDLQ